MDVNKDVKFCRFVCFVFFFWFFIGLSNLTFTTLLANSADNKLENFLIIPRKQDLTLYANCLHWRQFAWNAKSCCLGKIRKKKHTLSAENCAQSAKLKDFLQDWMCVQQRQPVWICRLLWLSCRKCCAQAHILLNICLFKYIENFTTQKWKFSDKNADIFRISAQNIDCGYSLELPHRGSSNEYPQCFWAEIDCGYSLELPHWGSSNEYPQSMFLAEIRKITYTPVNPNFTI